MESNPLSLQYFYAKGINACEELKPLIQKFLDQKHSVAYQSVDVEDPQNKTLLEKLDIFFIPTVLIGNNDTITRIEGFEPYQLSAIFDEFLGKSRIDVGDDLEETVSEEMTEKLHNLIGSAEIMVFIKGSPMSPRCKFTRELVHLLESHGLEFGYFDILQDNDVRRDLKVYSKWQTYPQVYVRGQLVGGLDSARLFDWISWKSGMPSGL